MPSSLASAAPLVLLFAGACGDTPAEDDTSPAEDTVCTGSVVDGEDRDGDGYPESAGDCNDSDPSIHPGAEEVPYDGTDQDCEDGDLTDVDGDGHDATVVDGDDCRDDDPTVYPGATEVPADGVDQDCDGREICFVDDDLDGYGTTDTVRSTDFYCRTAGQAAVDTDCDDADPAVNPGMAEVCNGIDDDCDGVADGAPWCEDCTNGSDDDEDGLADCEDGDCAVGEPCLEILCADGLDGDDDGLADCDDDDCWSLDCHPAGVRARVHGGTLTGTVEAHDEARRAARAWHQEEWRKSGEVRSVWGTVQVLPPGAASWGATDARTTCPWAVDLATFWYHASHESGAYTGWILASGSGPVRSGVEVGSGCRLAGSSFLPPRLYLVAATDWAGARTVDNFDYPPRYTVHPGLTWYLGVGGIIDSAFAHETTSYWSSSHISGSTWSGTVRHMNVDRTQAVAADLSPAGTWVALP